MPGYVNSFLKTFLVNIINIHSLLFPIHLQREMIIIVKQPCPSPLVLMCVNILLVGLLRAVSLKAVRVGLGQGGKDTYDFTPRLYLAGAISRCLLSAGLRSQMLQS